VSELEYPIKTDVMAAVLRTAIKGRIIARIIYSAYLPATQVQEYLRALQERGLLTYDEELGTYSPTEKGLHFLRICDQLGGRTALYDMGKIESALIAQ
jgi:predicted transcriptional regulator